MHHNTASSAIGHLLLVLAVVISELNIASGSLILELCIATGTHALVGISLLNAVIQILIFQSGSAQSDSVCRPPIRIVADTIISVGRGVIIQGCQPSSNREGDIQRDDLVFLRFKGALVIAVSEGVSDVFPHTGITELQISVLFIGLPIVLHSRTQID
ncbi:hypothetical protein D3C73_1307380 [compost metagenome]